jgi:ADP-ribose pyrophosphatase
MTIEWKKIKEEPYRAGYRKMIKRFFKLPDNRTVDFDIKHEGPAACILAITEDNKVVLAKQYRPGPEKILMELPGGRIDPGENAEEGIRRELLEETGYSGNIQFVGTTLDCAYSTMIRYNYIVINCKKIQEPKNEANEFIEVVELPLKEFKQLLRSGEMTDIESGYLCLDFLENKKKWKK